MSDSGSCIWITGLSGAGKTTTSKVIHKKLISIRDSVVLLDGDQLRRVFNNSARNYGRQERVDNALIYSRLIKELVEQGVTVIIAVIGLYKEIHEWNRLNINNYFDVLLDVPIEELERRDPKGMYKRFRNGEIQNVAGLDISVDLPETPWMNFNWRDGSFTPEDAASKIIEEFNNYWSVKNR